MNPPSDSLKIHTNGRLRSLVTANGHGGLFFDWIALTRWSEAAPDACGPMIYLHEGGKWSRHEPCENLTVTVEVGIAVKVDAEIRKITLSNTSGRPREIELTTYAEISLNHPMGDAGHPAFSKLFVQTAVEGTPPVLLARRRPRGMNENWPWMAQALIADSRELSWQTNRAAFIGRGNTPLSPAAMQQPGPMPCQTGNVLDPVMAWRCALAFEPNETKTVWLITAVAADEQGVKSTLKSCMADGAAATLLDEAKAADSARLIDFNIGSANARRYDEMAAKMLFGRNDRRVPVSLSGSDVVHRHPLSSEEIRIIATGGGTSPGTRDLFSAVPYWQSLGLQVRLYVMDDGSMASKLAAEIQAARMRLDENPANAEMRLGLAAAHYLAGDFSEAIPLLQKAGNDPHIRPRVLLLLGRVFKAKGLADQSKIHLADAFDGHAEIGEFHEPMPQGTTLLDPASFTPEELAWWLASAQLVTGDEISTYGKPGPLDQTISKTPPADATATLEEPLQCFNGHGGFSADGREYVIPLSLVGGHLRVPPMPWVNVLANPDFGCIVSERGAGYTWSRNSQANRLTPWSNDPVSDPHGEAFYLRDEASGTVWSPLPGPCEPRTSFVVRHGFGRTRFLSASDGITQTVEFIVPPQDPVKLVSILLRNDSAEPRRLVFSSYHKLLLCSSPDRHHATLAWTDAEGTQHAVNPRAGDFAGGRVFSFTAIHGAAGDFDSNNSSSAFIGGGSMAAPAGTWENARGFGRDACFSRRISFTLAPASEVEIVTGLGEVMAETDESRIIARYRKAGAIDTLNAEVDAHWETMLDRLKIRTPMPEVDLMVNGWLLYQNLACRIWGRSAFYQSGGAYGFRDQLQDSGALAASHPGLMRAQILLHAAQQFPEGDVTHWWHPEPMGRGMRTKFADDLLWLPYLTDHYLRTTGDRSVLREMRPFIEGPLLKAGEDEEYMKPEISTRQASVFEHCCLAIDKSLTKGAHGLPLMGIGDWNDGMSRIGREGQGESVWMGFFLFTILNRWIPLCEEHGESARVGSYTAYRDELLVAINDAGWDGEWYRRAYYDDGTPLGTHTDDECRIDALAQAWAVISKAAPADRAAKSLDSLERELIDTDHDIIRLLHPPFVNTPHDPGYIKGYVAGVRENGGQYTHAACWVIRAMAEAGRRDEAAMRLRRLSPVWHSRNAEAVATYQVEPYVVAADIYGADPHVGRGGWTWYTGSAGWMFRVAVESVLGLRLENGDSLVLDPKVPDAWPGFGMDYRTVSGQTLYRIEVSIPHGKAGKVIGLAVDGQTMAVEDGVGRWKISDDGNTHPVEVVMG